MKMLLGMIDALNVTPQDLDLIMRHYLYAGNQDRIYSEQGDWFSRIVTVP